MNLTNLDIEFLLDKSGSMKTADCPGGKTRWKHAEETMVALASYAETFDKDGITVVPFAGNYKVHEGVTAARVSQVFAEHQPMGSTDTARVVGDRIAAYFSRKAKGAAKPVLLFVLTDGSPDDQNALADVIVAATKRMDRPDEISIKFVQAGHDPEATKSLLFLDENLGPRGAKHDIVATVKVGEVENYSIEDLIQKT